MKNEIKLEIIELVEKNINMDPEDTCEAVCLYMGQLIEDTVLPAYRKIADAYRDEFGVSNDGIESGHMNPITNAIYKLNDEYSIKAFRRMSYVADMLIDNSEELEMVIAEYRAIDPESPTIPYLNQALSLQNNTAEFIRDAEAVMLEVANIK